MDKDKVLNDIFNNDPFGLLDVNAKTSKVQTADARLLAYFKEINDFIKHHGAEPKANIDNISEYQLYSRLKNLKENEKKIGLLKAYDIHHLLPNIDINPINESQENTIKPKEINSIDDLLNDDALGILDGDTAGLFDFKHTPKNDERAKTDFIARRKPCKNFAKYEPMFKEIQQDLTHGKRELIEFNEKQLIDGNYFVHNGIVLLLEKSFDVKKDKFGKKDGRTKIIFENGTESSMKLRSLGKNLFTNGKTITQNFDKINASFVEEFSKVTHEDEEVGYIYVLESKSKDKQITAIKNLYKIGYSKIKVEERIKNAEKEPTYLMAAVSIQSVWQCFNLNPQKLEQLLHNFFGNSCLELDILDKKGKRHTPREWFIAPINVIEQAIQLIINGKILDYKFDSENNIIVKS